jgi:serine/threonine-protein kinase HipA
VSREAPLGVWLHGTRVAEIVAVRNGGVSCTYSAEALDRFPSNIPLLSCSLPLRPRRQDASVSFAGLLPEGQHLQAMAAAAHLPAYDTFGLLARFGRDVAGAIVISADDPGKRVGGVEPYEGDTLAEAVAALPERPLDLHDDSELSIAGLQDKLLLVDLGGGKWGRPQHGRPSTHILKVEDRRYPGMAEREVACLHLARAAGLTTIDARVEVHADFPCVVVSRFDRIIDGSGIVERVHQEDACQALAREPRAQRGRGKYQAQGGPSFADVATILEQWARDPIAELVSLVKAAAFTALIGNADAHGKNVALLHREPEFVELAPLYDTVPTVLWPKLRRQPAMIFGPRVAEISTIRLDDLLAEARSWRLNQDQAAASIEECVNSVLEALDADVPEDLAASVSGAARRLAGVRS